MAQFFAAIDMGGSRCRWGLEVGPAVGAPGGRRSDYAVVAVRWFNQFGGWLEGSVLMPKLMHQALFPPRAKRMWASGLPCLWS